VSSRSDAFNPIAEEDSSRLGAATGTFLLPLCVARFGVHVALDVCVAFLAIGGVTSYLWAPETRQVRLGHEN
jgi:putative MFS transporter